ncbi:MAG: hypothetical protein J4478_05310 [Candidatus Diapherotrites archaeon]|uniref:Uncharacterized protein n=1 Tax=Candidatus Iainarchaeum sp. TaxID=3101447 RepID=A0A7J4JUQ1_9ARCH|nr:hypothetical protein [Candidatus Diapherotrites archaeon]HIH21503.1 hypothetical protein [Candidatus Diapherotrites archaeon]
MAETNTSISFFLIGMALGLYLPIFEAPVEFLNTYLGLLLIVVAIIIFVK